MCLKRLYDILTSWGTHWLGRLPLLGWPVRGSNGPTRKHTFHMRTNQSRAHTVSHLLCLALTVQEKRVLRLNHPELNTRQVDPTLIAQSPPPPSKLDNPNLFPLPCLVFPTETQWRLSPSLLLLPSGSGASPCSPDGMPPISSGNMNNNKFFFQGHGPLCIVTWSPLEGTDQS